MFDVFNIQFKYQIDMIGSGMFPKAEMRATAVDGGGKVAKFYIGIGIVLHDQGQVYSEWSLILIFGTQINTDKHRFLFNRRRTLTTADTQILFQPQTHTD